MPGNTLISTNSNASNKPFISKDKQQSLIEDDAESGYINRCFISAVLMTILGTALPIGHNIGVINNPQQVIRAWIGVTATEEYGVTLSPYNDLVIWSLVVSLFVVGATIGSAVAGAVADRSGRRFGLLLVNILSLSSSVLFMMCSSVRVIELVILGRLFSGVASGIGTGLVPLYLSEICPSHLKGVMGAILPVGLTIGILLSQIFGTSTLMGTEHLWPFLVGGHGLYIMLSLFLYPFTPKSPTYLALVVKDKASARRELMRLRSSTNDAVDKELMSLCSDDEDSKSAWSVGKVLRTQSLKRPLICVMVLNAGQQLVGINAVFYYSTLVFKNAGLSIQESQIASLACAVVNVVMSVSALVLIRYFRRKLLLVLSLVLYIICQVTLLITLKHIDKSPAIPYIAMTAITASVFAYGIGLGPVPYMFGAEIFPDGPRAIGLSFGAMSNYACNLLVGLCFPLIQEQIKESSFGVFIATSILFIMFTIFYMPETFQKEEKRPILPSELEVTCSNNHYSNNV